MRLPLSRDGRLILLTCGLRSLAYGFLSVILGLYLDALGLPTTAIGWIFTAALAGGAVMTMMITAVADSYGRKTLLIGGALLMALAGSIFAVSQNPLLLAIAAVFGTISPSGRKSALFSPLSKRFCPRLQRISTEQPFLPLTISLDHSVERLAHWPLHCRRSSLWRLSRDIDSLSGAMFSPRSP